MPDADGKEVQYWDSPLYISFLTETIPHRIQVFRRMLRGLQSPAVAFRVVGSTLILTEVRPSRSATPETERVISALFDADWPFLQFYAVTRSIALLARNLAMEHQGLTNPDAIHIATALFARADVLYTFDGARESQQRRSGGLLRLDGRCGNPPLRIEEPKMDEEPPVIAAPPTSPG